MFFAWLNADAGADRFFPTTRSVSLNATSASSYLIPDDPSNREPSPRNVAGLQAMALARSHAIPTILLYNDIVTQVNIKKSSPSATGSPENKSLDVETRHCRV